MELSYTRIIEISLLIIAAIAAYLIPFSVKEEPLVGGIIILLIVILMLNKSYEEFIKNIVHLFVAFGFGYVGLHVMGFSITVPF